MVTTKCFDSGSRTDVLVQVRGLKKDFGKLRVLKGIDLNVHKGDVIVLIGPSGSGKSTLLRSLNLLEKPTDGQILFEGKDLTKAKTAELCSMRERMGMVFQQFNLFPQYTVLKNVMLAQELMRIKGSAEKLTKQQKNEIRKDIEENSRRLLDMVGLTDKAANYPCQLSGGQQQRVAIARALAMSPDILCFDEPTSALDPELTGEVLRVIRGLKSSDRTMIVVTHEMNFARSVADKVIFMADGVIEEIGTPDEVFTNPKSEKTKAFLQKSLENPMP